MPELSEGMFKATQAALATVDPVVGALHAPTQALSGFSASSGRSKTM